MSASWTPASVRTSRLAPFPTIPIISDTERILSRIFESFSIRVISFPSVERSLQRLSPIFPAPTITIFIKILPFYYFKTIIAETRVLLNISEKTEKNFFAFKQKIFCIFSYIFWEKTKKSCITTVSFLKKN